MSSCITWERTIDGNTAELRRPSPGGSASRSYAEAIIKSLMHEVTLMTAAFQVSDETAFGKCAEVSVFSKSSAEFFGLYMATPPSPSAIYSIRHFFWDGSFGTLDGLLAGLSSETIFFRTDILDQVSREIVDSLDSPEVEEGDIEPLRAEGSEQRQWRLNYFIAGQTKSSMRSYRGNNKRNERMEALFGHLRAMHEALKTMAPLTPIPGSFNILYSSDCYSRVFDRLLPTMCSGSD